MSKIDPRGGVSIFRISLKYKKSRDEITTKYEYIFKDDIEKIRKIYERFRTNMKNREVLQKQSMKSENSHETYVIGPLFSVPSIVNGNG